MAYVSIAEWRPEQVTEWLKGLDNSIVSYIHWFSNNEINGQQLLNLSSDELTHLGVYKLGHQELILEAVQHLRNFHYELDRENLQFLALKVSCAARSLHSEIRDQAESSSVPTQIMADVANVIHNVKPLVSWLDRSPFAGQLQYADFKSQLLSLSLQMATCAQRDRFAERPVAKIRTCSSKLAKLADSIIQDVTDPMILQPATLDLATIKKKVGEELDFFLVPSFHGIHQIGDMKLSSPAHQSGKIQEGDEIVQVNYQTVVGWSRKKVLALFEESPNDLLITLKRRPRHVKMYGQIYMKPYRLPSRKRALPYSRWNDNLPSPRPELLTIPHFDITRTVNLMKNIESDKNLSLEPSGTSSSSDEEFGQPLDSQSPVSMRLYLPKPRAPIQRRFTLSGPPRPSAQSEQFWRELQLERSWRSNQNNSQGNASSSQNVESKEGDINEMFQLRDKSASLGNSIATASSRSGVCVSFSKARIGSVKFDLKFDALKNNSAGNDKAPAEERDKKVSDKSPKAVGSNDNHSKGAAPDEAASSKQSNSESCEGLSISELNKLKRDAFFNNMDCQNGQNDSVAKCETENSSEKVKRVIENFKMEITKTKKDMSEVDILKSPGKVMELIENFERVKNQDFAQPEKVTPPKGIRERNRLDKSCSTPAYDTSESNSVELEMDIIRSNPNSALAQKIAAELSQRGKFEFNTCIVHENKKNEVKKEGLEKEQKVNISPEKQVVANNEKQVVAEPEVPAKEQNVSKDLEVERKPAYSLNEQDKSDSCAESSSTTDASQSLDGFTSSIQPPNTHQKLNCDSSPLSKPDVKTEEQKPVPAQRKSKLPPKNNQINPPCPLPPKPRSKPLPLSPEEMLFNNTPTGQVPPEPPPRPESTFSKPIPRKLESNDDIIQEKDLHSKGESMAESPSASAGRNNFVISSPVPTPGGHSSNLYDFKPLSAASPTGRKNTKALNALPSGPVTTEKEKAKTSGSTLESLKAMLTLGKKGSSVNSPRSVRKKSAMLAKKRNVGVKEFTTFENSGFLWYRNRKGTATASWTKYYFILQSSNFYGFKSRESAKADLFIHLPGFTCTLAEEVKSREFSFKIYHMGTVFYFAANSEEDLQQWLDSVNLAISFQDDKFLPESVTYSQTDSDSSDTEPELETCFPTSPKMKKVLGSSPVPKPARSHQNLASDSKKQNEVQKRFGSLKKLTSQKHSASNGLLPEGNECSEVASLDRKYLRFLGKSSPTPVPTSRFRSYRRMQPVPAVPSKGAYGKAKSKSKNVDSNTETVNPPANDENSSESMTLHSSIPSLVFPDMADYRVAEERLSDFRRLKRINPGSEPSGFMILDQFLQRRHEESLTFGVSCPSDFGGAMTLEQFLLTQDGERLHTLRLRQRLAQTNEFSVWGRNDREGGRHKSTKQNKLRVCSGPNKQSTSSQSTTGRPKKAEPEKFRGAPRNAAPTSEKSMCQPPVAHCSSALNQEDGSAAVGFELPLEQSEARRLQLGSPSKKPECNRKETPGCQGIEYPPAFEPETYTLQHMLRNRKKRDSANKNK